MVNLVVAHRVIVALLNSYLFFFHLFHLVSRLQFGFYIVCCIGFGGDKDLKDMLPEVI